MILPTLSVFSSMAVGLVFLFTGGVKALSPSGTINHFDKLKLMPFHLLRWLLGVATVVECTLGVALITRVYPQWVFPAALWFLVAFLVITYWSSKAKGIDDCGCYGQMYAISPALSMLLDGLYAALIGFAWAVPVTWGFTPFLELAIVVESVVVCGSVTFMSHLVFRKWGEDLLDLSPAKVGRKWNPEWLAGYTSLQPEAAELIVLMSPTCSACKAWVKPLNKISARPDMPRVVAGMAAADEEISRVVGEFGIEFPVLRVKQSVMDRLVQAFPTAVTVENGIIRSKDRASLPPHLVGRLKQTPQGHPAAATPLWFLNQVRAVAGEERQ